MEIIHNPTYLKEDRNLLVITHLTQLLTYITGFGGFVVPLILWLTNKERVNDMDEHGKEITNFQISLFIYCIVSIPAILIFGLGILTLIVLGILGFILPIINAIKASNGEKPNYYISISFIK